MSNLDRIYNLNLDLVYEVQNDDMEFSVNDVNTSVFYVTFTRNRKEVLNLRGKSVVFYVVKPNGNIVYTNLQYDLNQEKFYCDLSTGFKNLLGNYMGQIVVYDSETEERVVIPTHISFTVVSDILENAMDGIDEEEQMTILESLINDIHSWSGKIDEAINKANESFNMVDGVKQIALTNQDDISILEDEVSEIKDTYTTKKYVDDEIERIDVTEELKNYATKQHVDESIENIEEQLDEQLKDYATKIYVDDAIDSVDVTEQLEDYATKEYVDKAMENVDVAESTIRTERNNATSVAEIIGVAQSYYKVRWRDGNKTTPTFLYDTNHTVLGNNYNPNDEQYAGAIDCSTFIGLILRGIPFEKSPYAHLLHTEDTDDSFNGNDVGNSSDESDNISENFDPANLLANTNDYSWAINPFEWSNKLVNNAKPVRTASQLAQWMAERGQIVPLDETFSNLQRGDIIFWAKKSSVTGDWLQPNRYKHISHVAICLNVMDAPLDDFNFPIKYPKKHTMLEVTTSAPYVLNRTLEKTSPDSVVMICRPDLGTLGDDFVGGISSSLGITDISKLFRKGIYYLTSEITGGLPTDIKNGTYYTLRVEKTYTNKGKVYSIIQTLFNAKTNGDEYRRTQYCYSHEPNSTDWTPWKKIGTISSDLNQDVNNHIGNINIHVTSIEKETWNNKADKNSIPTKISQLTNDSGFLTSIPSEYVTETELNQAIEGVDVTGQLGDYAKKTEIPTKTSQLTNDSNFLTSVPSEYVTDTELTAKGYLTQHQDISHLASKDYVNTAIEGVDVTDQLGDYATKEYVNTELERMDLSEYAKLTDLDGLFDDVALNEQETTDSQTAIDFYSDGEVVKTVYFSGGGGTSSTSAYISTQLSENVMVSTGESFDLILDFASPNLGKGTLKVFINDKDSLTTSIGQGESTTIIRSDLLSKGQNKVVVYVLDRVGVMSNSLTFYVRYGSLEITSDFDVYSAYDYGSLVRYYFTPTAVDTSLSLTMYMSIDGQIQEGIGCSSDTRGYYTFPANLSVGKHLCKAWVEDSNGSISNELVFNLIILDADSLVVASDTQSIEMEEGEQLSLDYKVYMRYNSVFNVKIYVDNNLVDTGTCGLTTSYYKTSSLSEGLHTVKVEVFDLTNTKSDYVAWTVNITPSTYQMKQAVTTGALFVGSAVNKSNSNENRDKWIGIDQDKNNVEATLVNFSFNEESGWINDQLLITGNSYVEVPVAPLSDNAKYGFTLDIEFSTKPIGVEDALVLDLWDEENNCGIKITTEELIMQSKAGNRCDLYFEEDTIVSAMFIIDRNEGTAKIYLDGVMCEAFHLTDYEVNGVKYLEDFTVTKNIKLGGSGHSAIRNLRVYQIALTTEEILNNFIANKIVKSEQRDLVNFQKGEDLPTMTIYCDFSGLGKDDKKPCNIAYVSPDVNKYGQSFNLDGKYSQLQYQGTSSMAYPIKNYRINPRDRNGKKKINPFTGGQPESRFTLKADFITSNHAHNTGMAKFISDKLYNYNNEDEKTMNPMRWYLLQNGGDVNTVRETINGFPIRLILVNDGTTTLNEGQAEPTPNNTKDMGIFNFNNDKDNLNTMGMDTKIFPNCISYEVTANSDTSAGAFIPFTSDLLYGQTLGLGMLNTDTGVVSTGRNDWRTSDYIEVQSNTEYIFYIKTNGSPRYALYDKDKVYISGGSKTTFTTTENTKYVRVSDVFGESTTVVTTAKLQKGTELDKQDPNAELSYLQQSFELRYPDEDDVGKDYGYLGMMSAGVGEISTTYTSGYLSRNIYHVNRGNPFGSIVTSDSDVTSDFIEWHEGYPITLNVPTTTYGVGVVAYNSNKEGIATMKDDYTWVTTLQESNIDIYATTINITNVPTDTEYIRFCCNTQMQNSNQISIHGYNNAFSPDYGLKRVIDWVGNCSDEEFVRDFELYFNKHYTFRYYLLVVLMAGVDNLG